MGWSERGGAVWDGVRGEISLADKSVNKCSTYSSKAVFLSFSEEANISFI